MPEAIIHTQEQDTRIVREHYDRGDDFFEWFLGERMVYTCAFFENSSQTLEEGQDNKMNLACNKLQLKPGERLLDVGCGWGTLARHSAKYFGVDATGVTLGKNQAAFGNRRIKEWDLEDKARVLCLDYRDTPKDKFDKIISLEMVEHVGVKNLQGFYEQMRDQLVDDGLFLLQWTGVRRGGFRTGLASEDLIWIMFMGKYIFPGADASLCPSAMLKSMEKAGWETHSVENVTIHYGWTIKYWHDNWLSNKEKILATYGERWFRIWHMFLAWSTIIARQGNASCQQVVLNKNLNEYDRTRWITNRSTILGDREKSLKPDVPAVTATNGKSAPDATLS